jgi:hypothetical protein
MSGHSLVVNSYWTQHQTIFYYRLETYRRGLATQQCLARIKLAVEVTNCVDIRKRNVELAAVELRCRGRMWTICSFEFKRALNVCYSDHGFCGSTDEFWPWRTPPIQSSPPVIPHTVVMDPSTGRAVEAEAVFSNVQFGKNRIWGAFQPPVVSAMQLRPMSPFNA